MWLLERKEPSFALLESKQNNDALTNVLLGCGTGEMGKNTWLVYVTPALLLLMYT